ncbi:cystine/glutamate transporter-like [Sebastes fasciatus]|uniref:cystine/glutamate transporter-like n=1 Tax=Sebastes fasciatus TaxID=394691 RepID=UPI003D9E6371
MAWHWIGPGRALSYAELGTCINKSGGHYTYILEAFGPQMAFIKLWADLIAIRPASLAVTSLTFGQYILEPLFMPCDIPPTAVKLATAIGLTSVMYLNSMSVTWTNRIQIFLTFSKLLAIGIIIVPGMYQLFKGETKNFENAFELSRVKLSGMPLAFYSGMYAYAGCLHVEVSLGQDTEPQIAPSVENEIPLMECTLMLSGGSTPEERYACETASRIQCDRRCVCRQRKPLRLLSAAHKRALGTMHGGDCSV